jgi:spermidine/putrescine transport system ATP-binding protein
MEGETDQPAIALEGISKAFGSIQAVTNCTLRVERGAFVSLLGPSGCGKTTLLRIIGGFEPQDSGRVLVHGELVDRLPPNKRDVNTVFQRYALFPNRTVGDNIGFPLEVQRVPKQQRRQRVREMLDLVQLPGIEARSPAQLSGGQAQRVALARALIGRPKVLLLDEPLAALDLKLRKAMQLELRRIQEEVGSTFLYVTHDQEEALTMSDTVVVMNHGQIVQEGTPEEIYRQPTSVFASHFIGETNLLEAVVIAADEGAIRLTIGDHEVLGPTADAEAGDRVVLSIRPERLLPTSTSRAALNGLDNRIRGVVRRRIFLGSLVRALVEVAPDLTLTIQSEEAEAGRLIEGETIEIGWAARDAVVLPAPGEDG